MKKSIKIITMILIILLVLLICGYFILKMYTTNEANKFLIKLNKYKFNISDLETGKYFDFSKDENTITKTKISEGIIYKDINNEIRIISNVKINGLYCSLENNKFNCGLSKSQYTNILDSEEYIEYTVGDAVTLVDGTNWHVIHNSNKYSKYVTLLRDERVDINGDGFTMDTSTVEDPDRIPFDKNKIKKYDTTKEGNIGYYIENTYRQSLIELTDIAEIRLLTTDELEKIEQVTGMGALSDDEIYAMYDAEDEILESIMWEYESPRPYYKLGQIKITDKQYEKLMPNWLYNAFSGNYWLQPKENKVVTAVWNGMGYTSPKPTTGYSLKPVITLNKRNVR